MIVAFFLLLFFVMTPMSLYLLAKHGENRLLVWGAFILFTAGLSGLQVGLEKIVLPHITSLGAGDTAVTVLSVLTAFLNIIVHSFPYYLILVFFIHFAGYPKTVVTVLLLVPVLLAFVFTDAYTTSWMNYSYILSWGIPYMLASIILFVKGMLKIEKEKVKKLQYFGLGMIIFIPEAFLLFLQLEGSYFQSPVELLILIPILCLFSLLAGLILYGYNVFTRFQSTAVLTKMQLGTSLMQHAFKNAISKNKLYALTIKRSLETKQYEEVDDHLNSLLRSNDHLMDMVSKLSYLTRRRLNVELEPTDIALVLEEVIDEFVHTPVSFEKQFSSVKLAVDRTLMTECFSNIISNAVEAIDGQGQITIIMEKTKRHVKIHFTDTGRGMDKEQINNLFEPFYSTKHKSGYNFGLGMFHVKKIMNAHRGKVKVTSQPGRGTTVTLMYPGREKESL
ncbi:HAMP domain-containing histidine kinase [Alkalihalobacillus oceani]|uniref:histidine kinase n=1 Tax=Halalkalibacter oceani TaxID=1653776 RepID=A0A9X2DRI8_9BACI|nr:HAMP domain-containing sensor histidine kinase [Halalkalibacter oceani]MCM3714117.1 HAMP domain-containing histidine kinase [Halalkalibacter oceani]